MRQMPVGTKLLYTFALGALLWVFQEISANAVTLEELQRSCNDVISATGSSQSSSIDIPASGLPCWYYMAAVQNMSVIVDQNGDHLLGVCPPSSMTLLDYVRVFVRYAQANKPTSDDAGAEVLMSLLKSFPCR